MAIKIYEVAMVKQRLKNVTINDIRAQKNEEKKASTAKNNNNSHRIEMKNLLKEMIPLAPATRLRNVRSLLSLIPSRVRGWRGVWKTTNSKHNNNFYDK